MSPLIDSMKYESQRDYLDLTEKFKKMQQESESLLRNPLGTHSLTLGGSH